MILSLIWKFISIVIPVYTFFYIPEYTVTFLKYLIEIKGHDIVMKFKVELNQFFFFYSDLHCAGSYSDDSGTNRWTQTDYSTSENIHILLIIYYFLEIMLKLLD